MTATAPLHTPLSLIPSAGVSEARQEAQPSGPAEQDSGVAMERAGRSGFESTTAETADASHQLAFEALAAAHSASDPRSPLAALRPALLSLANAARNDALDLLSASGEAAFAADRPSPERAPSGAANGVDRPADETSIGPRDEALRRAA
ncbi:hypothetical protein [Paraburkholderia fungorum]|jgi:hypothetical protein|uniref:hypothetical protein n=1 Tax=Paraburkholderia fungorum TaxID=134537 RepID=UPI000D05E4F4|nr:hypothetical protein [Paraburkholderia fungorum]